MAFALGPFLGQDETGFDGFTEADFVGQDDAIRQWRSEGKQGRIHLMRIHVHLGTGDGLGQRVVGSPLQRQPVGEIAALIAGVHQPWSFFWYPFSGLNSPTFSLRSRNSLTA